MNHAGFAVASALHLLGGFAGGFVIGLVTGFNGGFDDVISLVTRANIQGIFLGWSKIADTHLLWHRASRFPFEV